MARSSLTLQVPLAVATYIFLILLPLNIYAAASTTVDEGNNDGHVVSMKEGLSTAGKDRSPATVGGSDVANGRSENSMGIEAVAIFALVTFLVRLAADIAQRVRNGRKKRSPGEAQHMNLNRLAHLALTLISDGTQLYEHRHASRGVTHLTFRKPGGGDLG